MYFVQDRNSRSSVSKYLGAQLFEIETSTPRKRNSQAQDPGNYWYHHPITGHLHRRRRRASPCTATGIPRRCWTRRAGRRSSNWLGSRDRDVRHRRGRLGEIGRGCEAALGHDLVDI